MSAVLLPAGVFCLKKAMRGDRAFLPLAVVPLMLAVQQASEGVVWMGLHQGNDVLVAAGSRVFLFFALCFWLFWIPLSVLMIERHRPIKWVLGALTLMGLGMGLALYLPLVLHLAALSTSVVNHSIQYDMAWARMFPTTPRMIGKVLYLVIVAVPLLAFRSKKLLAFGVGLILSAIIGQIVYWYAFTSVWCFFAAVMSVFLCFVFRDLAEDQTVISPVKTSVAGPVM